MNRFNSKRLNNPNKSHRLSGHKMCRLGLPLGIHDCNGKELHTGDVIKWCDVECILLYVTACRAVKACICTSWYGNDIYDSNNYGKAYDLPLDDGARMTMQLVKVCA